MFTYRELVNEIYMDGFVSDQSIKPFRVPENFDSYGKGPGWLAYRGGNDWEQGTTGVAVYFGPEGYTRDQARIWFEVKFPLEMQEAISSNAGPGSPNAEALNKWGRKASYTWLREAERLHKATKYQVNPGDPLSRWYFKPWRECFTMALKTPTMQQYVKEWGVDHTDWVGMKNSEPMPLHESFHEHKEWFIFEGEGSILAVFEDGTRQNFKLNFRDNRGEDRSKWRTKAARTWKRLAREKYKDTDINEGGNIVQTPWKQCFEQALKDPEMKPFIDDGSTTPIFEGVIHEMTYDELQQSMKGYAVPRDGGAEVVGDNGRVERSKHVRTKNLSVVSTLGKDKNEHNTALFSYSSDAPWRTGGAAGHGHQGYIQFLESEDMGRVGDVEVNCSCNDYKYVWAKPNSDAGAGRTAADGNLDVDKRFGRVGGRIDAPTKPQNIFELRATGAGNTNNGQTPNIRNPKNVPGLCKHLLALGKHLDTKASMAATDQKQGTPVDQASIPSEPTKPKKPVNIFESLRNFAQANPKFLVEYEDV